MIDITFFKPNTQLVKSILDYANGRLIIDAGCGKKFPLVKQLVAAGAKQILGVDKEIDMNGLMLFRMMNMEPEKSIHILEGSIQSFKALYETDKKDVLLIFARPCHSTFVQETLRLKHPTIEALYITKPENLELYNDLGEFEDKAVKLELEGDSADNEVIFSIR